jgi:hypothetical protein
MATKRKERDQDEEDEEARDQDGASAEGDDGGDGDGDDGSQAKKSSPSLSAKEMTQAAVEALRDLTDLEPEAAVGLQWDGESWLVTLDVLELRRVPDTTDLMATYLVQLDDDGRLLGYERTRRFQRSQAEGS